MFETLAASVYTTRHVTMLYNPPVKGTLLIFLNFNVKCLLRWGRNGEDRALLHLLVEHFVVERRYDCKVIALF